MNTFLLVEVMIQGAIFSLVALATFLSSRLIAFDDLGTEGSFGMGGACAALCALHHIPLLPSLIIAMLVGMLVGLTTGFLHCRLGLNTLISGLCVTTGLFSVGLVAAGAHVALPRTAFLHTQFWGGSLPIVLLCMVIAFAGMQRLLVSHIGLLITASGENERMITTLGHQPALFKMATLGLSNSLVALAGALFVFHSGFFSINGNVGVLIIALSSMMLSDIISPLGKRLRATLLAGSFIYQILFAIILQLGVHPCWNNLIKAFLITILFILKNSTTVRSSS